MEQNFFKIKISRLIIYILFFIAMLGVSIIFTILDMNEASYWIIMYIFSMIISVYYIGLYTIDLVKKDSGFTVTDEGIIFNCEYFKNFTVPWTSISNIATRKSTILIFVYNPELYLDKINKLSAIIIKGSLKRAGTIFFIRTKQFHCNPQELEELIKTTYKKNCELKADDD